MQRAVFALAIALGATSVSAQTSPAGPTDVPKHKCDPKPEHPGRLATDNMRRNFDKGFKTWEACIKTFVDDRQKTIKANQDAANDAINEFNAVVTKLRADSGVTDEKK